jgi:pimeloyl-ACP methyl ester carboxylesterase
MKAQAIFGLERSVEMPDQPNIVLVHGAWADGSSWSSAIERLQADGYLVTAPQFPMTRLAVTSRD